MIAARGGDDFVVGGGGGNDLICGGSGSGGPGDDLAVKKDCERKQSAQGV